MNKNSNNKRSILLLDNSLFRLLPPRFIKFVQVFLQNSSLVKFTIFFGLFDILPQNINLLQIWIVSLRNEIWTRSTPPLLLIQDNLQMFNCSIYKSIFSSKNTDVWQHKVRKNDTLDWTWSSVAVWAVLYAPPSLQTWC